MDTWIVSEHVALTDCNLLTLPHHSSWLLQCAGVDALESYAQAPGIPLTLPLLDNPISQALHGILDAVRQHRCAFMSIRVLKRGDPAETLFYNCLIEDKNPAGMSYIEFLCAVHRQIQSMFK